MATARVKRCPDCGTIYDADGIDVCEIDGARLEEQTVEDQFVGRVLVDRFRIDALIGAGGMGRVYRAKQLSVDRDVAIKILHREAMLKRSATQRFLIEAKATSQLTNPHTVTLYDYGETSDGLPFIAMEFLSGQSLKQALVNAGKISPEEAIRIATETCDSLAEAHRRGIIHRDLKPDNIFLANTDDAVGFVKVLDFGIARAKSVQDFETLTRTGTVAGTPAYLSPEALMGDEVGNPSDIYALGVLLYEIVTGAHPFPGDTAFKVMRKHLEEVAPPLDQVLEGVVLPDGFSALIARCMAKDPARRPQDAGELRELMIKVASGQGLGQRSTTETRTVTRIATQESSAPDHERRPTVDGEQLATSAELSQPATEEVDRPTPTNHTRTFLIAAVALIGIGAIGFVALSGSEPEPAPAAATAQAVDSAAPQTPPPPSAADMERAKQEAASAPTPPTAAPAPKKVAQVQISISSDPEGAFVFKQGSADTGDNPPIGQTPMVLKHPKGTEAITFQLTKAGFKPKTVTVVPDKYRPIELSLERKEAAKSPAARIKPRKPARKPPKAKAKAPMAPKPSVKKPAVVPRAKPAPKPKKKNRREMLLD